MRIGTRSISLGAASIALAIGILCILNICMIHNATPSSSKTMADSATPCIVTAPAASGSTGVHFSGDKVRVFNTSNSNNGATIEEFTVTPSATPSVTPSATPSASDISQHNENKKEIIFIVMGERKNFKVWFQRLNINVRNHVTFIYGSYDESVNATEDNVICEQSNELFDCQTLFIPGTTWTQGRNRLAEEALRKEKKRGMKYDYWGFADDDAQLICDECVNLEECPESLSLKCWNRFLATIATEGALPENATTVVLEMTIEKAVNNKKWPKGFTAVSTYDAFVTVIKRDTVPLLLPYATLGNGVSEWISQAVLFCVMKICIPGSAVKFPFMYGTNTEHRPYKRGLRLPVVMDAIHANYDPYVSFDECSRIKFLVPQEYTHVFETAEECSANIPTPNLDYCAPLLDRFTAWEESIEYD